jgi:hypothetical protein
MLTATRSDVRHRPGAPRLDEQVLPILIGAAIAVAAIPAIVRDYSRPTIDYQAATFLFPVDFVLAAVALVGLPALVGRLRRRQVGLATTALALLTAAVTVTLALHPSGRGLSFALRLLALTVVADGIARLSGDARRLVVGSAAAVGLLETAVSLYQRATGHTTGIGFLSELKATEKVGGGAAPYGTTFHPYLLAYLAAVVALVCVIEACRSRRPGPWIVAIAVTAAPIGYTYGRAAGLGAVLAAGALAWALIRPPHALRAGAIAAFVIGIAVPAMLWSRGWIGRASQTVSGRDISTRRTTLVHQAIGLIKRHPLAGVGPGRYLLALGRRPDLYDGFTHATLRVVHDVPLLLVAEMGVFGVIAAIALLVLPAIQAWRGGPLGVALYAVLVPPLLLDQALYNHVQGLVILTLWAGFIDLVARDRVPAP